MSSNDPGKGIKRSSNDVESANIPIKKSHISLIKTKKSSRFGSSTSHETTTIDKMPPINISIKDLDTIVSDSNWSFKAKLVSKTQTRSFGRKSTGKVANAIFQDFTGSINCVFYDKKAAMQTDLKENQVTNFKNISSF